MDIQDIKLKLDIFTVAKSYGLQPDRNGMLKCPFHDDKTPSLKLYKETSTFNCFGCGANGDVIEFIQLKEASTGSACSKHEAILKAKAMAGITEIKTMPVTKTKNMNHTSIITLYPHLNYQSPNCIDSEGIFKHLFR